MLYIIILMHISYFMVFWFFFLFLLMTYYLFILYLFRLGKSVQFSRSVVSDSLWPPRLQHGRLPCPSPTPGAYSNSCPSSQWCHPTISSSVVPFSSRLQSFLASGSFLVSSLHQVVRILEFQLQHQSFQWTGNIRQKANLSDFLILAQNES